MSLENDIAREVDSPVLKYISYSTNAPTDTPDIPVDIKGFELNVRRCQWFAGACTALGLIVGGITLRVAWKDRTIWQCIDTGFHLVTLLCLLLPVTASTNVALPDNGSQRRRHTLLPSHPVTCIMLVTFSSIALGASSVHLYRQLQPTTSPSNPFLRMSPLLVIILNLVSFVSSGLMRREPKLYYRVPAFQLGSGLQATMTDENEGLKNWLEGKEGGVEPIGNVLDYDGCGVLPLLTGLFVFEVWRKSWTKPQLDERDLPQLPQRNRAQAIASEETNGMSHEQNFEDPLWQKKDEDGNPEKQFGPLGLLVHVWKPSLPTVIYGMILTAIATGLQFLPLLMDRQIIVLFEDGSIKTPEGRQWGYLMCFGASGLRIASFVVSNYTDFLENYLLHGRVRIKMEQMLYGKLLRSYDTQYTASTTNQEAAKGADKEKKTQLVTLFGNDMQQICIFAARICFDSVQALINFSAYFTFLYYLLGWSSFAALALVIMLLPIVRYYTRSVYRMSRRIPAERDKRVSVIRELIQNIKAIKLNAWEDAFEQKATLARERELKAIKTSKLAEAVLSTLEHWIPILAICLAYILHVVVRGEPFPPSTALIAQRTFAEALKSLLKTPKIINCVLSMRISCERLCFRRVSATWHCPLYSDDAPMSFKLDSMSFAFCPNSLNIVAGPTGSGKTLLLLSILGEAKILDGSIDAPRSTRDAIAGLGYRGSIADAATRARWLQPSIAYTPQTAYIEHGTIRDNIIFGQVFWEERYNQVLQACSLVDDLATLADGDMTELSTDTLSGGQQSRINLARSLYSRAQVMLLDDPLSAVDEKTAKHILEHALTGALVKGRTVILVTHKLSLCASKADRVVVLCNGRIAETLQPRHMERTAWMHLEEIAAETDIADRDSYIKENPETKPTYQLVKDEERKIGLSARRHLLSILVTAGGLGLWALILVSLIINEFLAIYHTAWTASWSSHENSHGDNYYALGSFVITLSRGIMMFFSAAVIVHAFTWRASAIMHRRLLSAFLAAPLQTMQTIPSGRFLNRFATDMEYFDLNLAYLTQTSLRMFFSIVGRFVSTTIQVPALLWVILAVLPILFSSQARLAKFLSDAKKLNAIWNSPLLTMINDSEHAVTVIRAFGAGEASAARMRLFQTQKRMAGLMEYSAWLLSRLCLQPLAILIPTATGVLVLRNTEGTAAWAGYTLNMIQFVTKSIYEFIMHAGKIDVALVTVERLKEYSELQPERGINNTLALPSAWPEHGRLEVQKLTVRYDADMPEVLHHVSFEVKPGERVAIVGRTGSGKSTLALALLGAVDIVGGKIKLDDKDITTLNIRDLRSRICMIPQEAVLTSGTLRSALDLGGDQDVVDIYEALRRVGLMNDAESSSEGTSRFTNLEQTVTPGGANFSRGERQQLSLARALLKKGKVLIMDEATSSIDYAMDEQITRMIKRCFGGVTMLVIAHRIRTIIDFDRVLVMSAGRVAEYDAPRNLLADTNSAFFKLCASGGEEELEQLRRMAGS